MSENQFYCARFYVTYRCNSRCVYCNVWQKKEFKNIDEMPLEKAKKLMQQCYEQGVRYVDFTGGEPTLYPYLAEVIEYAKKLGIKTEVTSNCIASSSKQKMLEIAKVADKFNTSLDTLDNESYHQIRGVDCCEKVKRAVQDIATMRAPKIMTVVTDSNIKELDKMIEYAAKNKALIYLSPMFPYIDKDGCYQISKYMPDIVQRIFKPYTVVLLHFMEFFKNSSAQQLPPCSANKHTLTFAPNGNLVLPCYHAIKEEIAWNEDLSAALKTEKFKQYMKTSGKLEVCRGCCVIPYFGISFNYQFNKYFLLQSFSEKLYHLKRDGLNVLLEESKLNTEKLDKELAEMMAMADDLTYKPDMNAWNNPQSPLYPAVIKSGVGVITPVYQEALTEDEYLAERAAKDCWQLTKVPHYLFDKFCQAVIYPMLQVRQQITDKKKFTEDVLFFQIKWWKFYMASYLQLDKPYDVTEDILWLKDYLMKMQVISSAKVIDELLEMLKQYEAKTLAEAI